jgi:DNA-binding LacI/PurR family transcriptional regulator
MPATLRDVALRAGVSVRTVSNVVNGYAPVSEEKTARVRQPSMTSATGRTCWLAT